MLDKLVKQSFWKDITHPDRIGYTYSDLIEPLESLLPKVLDQFDHHKMTDDFSQPLYKSFKTMKDVVPKIINANKTSVSSTNLIESAFSNYSSVTSAFKRSDSQSLYVSEMIDIFSAFANLAKQIPEVCTEMQKR